MEINGKVLGGVGGEGVLIESITGTYDTDAKGMDRLSLVFSGTAYTVLKNAYNKDAGFDELPESIPVSESIPVQLEETAGGKSLKITFDQLNKAFDLMDDPLGEREDEWQRLLEGTERSVFDKIVGKPIYFKARLKKDKIEGDKKDASSFYFNLQALAKSVKADAGFLEMYAKLKAKKAAADSQPIKY